MTQQIALTLAQQYVNLLRQKGIQVERAIVFGSQVRGTARAGSDIDVGIVSSEFTDHFAARLKLMRLRHEVSLDIEPHPFTPEQLADKWDTFATEIQKFGIELQT